MNLGKWGSGQGKALLVLETKGRKQVERIQLQLLHKLMIHAVDFAVSRGEAEQEEALPVLEAGSRNDVRRIRLHP